MSTLTPPWRRAAAAAAGVAAWLLIATFNLYHFSYPSMDSWCYLAPAAFAPRPLHLVMPLLGTFDGADRVWGLHWPGGPLLLSCLLPCLPSHPAVYVGVFLAQWLALAALTGALVARVVGNRGLGWFAAAATLVDHLVFNIAWFERHEITGAAWFVVALLAARGWPKPSKTALALLSLSLFAMPLWHPVCVAVGAAMLVWLAIEWRRRRSRWLVLAWPAAAYAAGLACFAGYYLAQPEAWSAFRDHASSGVAVTRAQPGWFPGRAFLSGLGVYWPTFSGAVFFVPAVLLSVWLAARWTAGPWRRLGAAKTGPATPPAVLYLGAWCCLAALVSAQSTYNGTYTVLAWPFALLLFCWTVAAAKRRFRIPGFLSSLLLGALLAAHALYLPARLWKWRQQGYPNYRAELQAFYDALPPARRTLIPEVLWEAARRGGRAAQLNTLPNNSLLPRRRQYEAALYAAFQPGDLLVWDTLQSQALPVDLDAPGWRRVAELDCSWQGRRRRGFDLIACRWEPLRARGIAAPPAEPVSQ